jgi:hypothetical protein
VWLRHVVSPHRTRAASDPATSGVVAYSHKTSVWHGAVVIGVTWLRETGHFGKTWRDVESTQAENLNGWQTHCRYEARCHGAAASVCCHRLSRWTPNLSPKGTTAVWDDDHLVFADIRSPGTMANIKKNPAVEVNVVDPFVRKGYRFKGVGEVIVDGARFEEIMRSYRSRWVDTAGSKVEEVIRGFVLVEVGRALPLISPAYDDASSDEQSIRKYWISFFSAVNESSL